MGCPGIPWFIFNTTTKLKHPAKSNPTATSKSDPTCPSKSGECQNRNDSVFFKCGPTPASFFVYFRLFIHFRSQRDSNSDRRSRRQERWPLDHHHGQRNLFSRADHRTQFLGFLDPVGKGTQLQNKHWPSWVGPHLPTNFQLRQPWDHVCRSPSCIWTSHQTLWWGMWLDLT